MSASLFPAFCKVFPQEEVKPDPAPASSVCCELLQDCPLHHNAALAHSSHCRRRVGGGDHQARAQRCLLVLVFPLRIIFKAGPKLTPSGISEEPTSRLRSRARVRGAYGQQNHPDSDLCHNREPKWTSWGGNTSSVDQGCNPQNRSDVIIREQDKDNGPEMSAKSTSVSTTRVG